MCWKHEWAMAINNLNSAIGHVQKAQERLQNRLVRNEKNLERMKSSKKYNYPKMLAPVEVLIEKNQRAIKECGQLIADFRARQGQLFRMVHVYGIKHSENPQRVYELMGKYQFPKAVVLGASNVIFKKEAES